jgi:hypothetical protein
MDARYERDRGLVAAKFPAGARGLTVDGVPGWLYSFKSTQGDGFTMFIYWESIAGQYKVKLVEPEGEKLPVAPAYRHLFNDGVLCLNLGAKDRINFLTVFTASRLWADGFSRFRVTGEWIGKHV